MLAQVVACFRERVHAMSDVWVGDEIVRVEADYLPDGRIQPTAFSWRGQHRKVVGLGRQWEEADGRHMLIIVPDGSRFELCLASDQSGWRLRRAWQRPYLA